MKVMPVCGGGGGLGDDCVLALSVGSLCPLPALTLQSSLNKLPQFLTAALWENDGFLMR